MNTKIYYLYRDASNYKILNEVVVEGTLTDEQKKTILSCLEDGEYFIPRFVGLPEKTFVDIGFRYDEQDDHPYFELTAEDIINTEDEATECITTDELVDAFVRAQSMWESMLEAEIKD